MEFRGVSRRRNPSQRTVWSNDVAFHSPVLDNDACFLQRKEEFAVEALVAKHVQRKPSAHRKLAKELVKLFVLSYPSRTLSEEV